MIIPKKIWISVREKWEEILLLVEMERTYQDYVDSFWVECALCHYLDEECPDVSCDDSCPLAKYTPTGGYWCPGRPSRLHNALEQADDGDWEPAKRTLKEFIKYLDTKIEEAG